MECEEGFYFNENKCCAIGKFWNGSACVAFAENGLEFCDIIDDFGQCTHCNSNRYL